MGYSNNKLKIHMGMGVLSPSFLSHLPSFLPLLLFLFPSPSPLPFPQKYVPFIPARRSGERRKPLPAGYRAKGRAPAEIDFVAFSDI